MRVSRASLQARRPSLQAGAELNVTPVMNMFIILIPFLISMTAFTHLARHEFDLPGNEVADHASARADLPLIVALGAAKVTVVRGDLVIAEWPWDAGRPDFESLRQLLRSKRPTELVLAVDDPITAADLVACLDVCRLAGWTDIGLAGGSGITPSKEGG